MKWMIFMSVVLLCPEPVPPTDIISKELAGCLMEKHSAHRVRKENDIYHLECIRVWNEEITR